MPTFTLTSWNTQGDFTVPAKAEEIDRFALGAPVVFLQEGGVAKAGASGGWTIFSGDAVGAFNARCTNYVLLPTLWAKTNGATAILLTDKKDGVVIGGGEAGRTAAAVGVGRMLFVSWHSISSKSDMDTSTLFKAIDGNPDYVRAYDTVVIAGDYNSAPKDIFEVMKRAGFKNYSADLVYSGGLTFNDKMELDFFVILSKARPPEVRAAQPSATMLDVAPSDHYPVQMTLTAA